MTRSSRTAPKTVMTACSSAGTMYKPVSNHRAAAAPAMRRCCEAAGRGSGAIAGATAAGVGGGAVARGGSMVVLISRTVRGWATLIHLVGPSAKGHSCPDPTVDRGRHECTLLSGGRRRSGVVMGLVLRAAAARNRSSARRLSRRRALCDRPRACALICKSPGCANRPVRRRALLRRRPRLDLFGLFVG